MSAAFVLAACGGSSANNSDSKGENVSNTSSVSEQSSADSKQTSDDKQDSVSSSSDSKADSSEDQPDENFKYKDYLVSHEEGKSAKYIFEAECTNITNKSGPGYSGANSGSAMAGYQSDTKRAYVTYLYQKGCSLNFFIVSDRDVEDASLSLELGGEFMYVNLDPTSYQIRVDYPEEKYLEDAMESEEGALGYWDDVYFSQVPDPTVNGGYYVDPWDCKNIEIVALGQNQIVGWSEFAITANLKLKKGITCISLITANDTKPTSIDGSPLGTMAAIAPVVDYLAIETKAQLGMFDQQNNNQGTNGCHF